MQNFKIEISDGIYDVFLHGAFIGHIIYSDVDSGYLVYPTESNYSGIFFELEEAVIELVFHMHHKTTGKIHMC